MNQLCKVCGEPAAGFHFGAFTCEGCKSFFGRTYNNISAIAGCKNNGDCVINKKNRTACKACRLRKCLLVGMSKSGSRYGRRSNWFKIHCLLQEQQTTAGNSSQNSASNNNNLEQLARLHQIHARQTYQDKTNPSIKSAIGAVSLTMPGNNSNANNNNNNSLANTNHLTNFLNPAKFFNGSDVLNNANTKNSTESRLSDTPSDSGASSAGDPTDDCTSSQSLRHHNLHHHQHHHHHHHQQQQQHHHHHQQHQTHNHTESVKSERNCNSAHQSLDNGHGDEDSDERERRRQQFLQIFRSHSEPLHSPFATFAFSQLPPPTPPATAVATATALAAGSSPTAFILPALKSHESFLESSNSVQEEPIDLSLKSRHSLSPDQHEEDEEEAKCLKAESLECNNGSVGVLTKSNPLDLTLVRSTQTLSG